MPSCFRILTESQSFNQTPSKANHPGKYDYESPVKSSQTKSVANSGGQQHQATPSSGGKRKVQLFKADPAVGGKGGLGPSSVLETPGGLEGVGEFGSSPEQGADFGVKPLEESPKVFQSFLFSEFCG